MKYFKRYSIIALCATSAMAFTAGANEEAETKSNQANIEWQNAEKFTDIRPTNEGRKQFRDRVLNGLESHINKLAAKLPEQQTLKMVVTNVDLAGQVLPASFAGLGSGGSDIRVVKQIHIPRITFSYELLDSSGALVKSETLKLKDMSFLTNRPLRYNNDFLRYEKKMLDDWFKDTFVTLKS